MLTLNLFLKLTHIEHCVQIGSYGEYKAIVPLCWLHGIANCLWSIQRYHNYTDLAKIAV